MLRFSLRALALAATASLLAACGGDSITGPQRDARQMAARFDHVADSLVLAGNYDAADGASALAQVLRMTDRLHTVTASVDGEPRAYHALLVQLQLPEQQCFPGEVCEPAPEFMQVVVGWRGQDVTDGFAFVMDATGTLTVSPPPADGSIPEPVDGEPAFGVFGGLFERAGERAWVATGGSVTTARARSVGACQSGELGPTPAGIDCRVGVVTFRADVALDEISEEGGVVAGSRRTLAIDGQTVAGLALTITEIPDQMRPRLIPRLSPRRILPMFH